MITIFICMTEVSQVKLTEMKIGDRATIIDLSGLNRLVKRRLTDLGAREGSHIHFRRALPFGGPFILEAQGQLIGLRRADASAIEVVPV
jgi:ferrous iron transport protein A